ncbi:hypothetical protein FSP39_009911 [Pinctada imbricata]|uniref:WD repeat-containing protein 60 n=1 Tax=Pinctada imbricata TaxID=66713 RepID=A0AA88YIV3_PINIB|nr:hypothetical protein FSP39_009911 [Pinctada imbricata]
MFLCRVCVLIIEYMAEIKYTSGKFKPNLKTIHFVDPPYVFSDPTYVFSDPTYVFSDPTYVFSDPPYVFSDPPYVFSDPPYVFSDPPYVFSDPPYVFSDPPYIFSDPPYVFSDPPYVFSDSTYVFSDPTYVFSDPTYVFSDPPYVFSDPPYVFSDPPYVFSDPPYVFSDPPYVFSDPPYVFSDPPYVFSDPPYVFSDPPYVFSDPPYVFSDPPYVFSDPPYVFSDPPYLFSDPLYVFSDPPYVFSDPPYVFSDPPYLFSDPPYVFSDPPYVFSDPPYIFSNPPYLFSDPTYVFSDPPYLFSDPPYLFSDPPYVFSDPPYVFSDPPYKDDIRKEREKLKRDRRERDGRDEEEIDTRKREGHRRREDDDRKERRRHDEDKRQNKDDDRRRKDEDRRSHRTDNDEEERERQRRERREKREGKSSRDTKEREQSKRKEEEESRSHKRHRDTDDKRSRDHDDRRRRRDEEDEDEKERRRQEERERRRKEKEGDKRNKDKDRDRDRDDRRQTNGESDDKHRRHKDQPESNEYRRGRYRDDDEDDYNDDRGGYGTSHQTPSASSSGLINFSGAKKQVMSRKANSKMEKRAADLLQMLELDVARYDMFDLPPVKEYELYIRNFGRTDAQQAYVQTNDDNIDRDVQTEEIDTRSKWTQHPAHDSTGCGRGDGKKDLDEEEVELQQNKVYDLSRLNKFVEQAGQVIAILLEEEREMSNSHESRGENRSNMAVSEGFSELNLLSLLKDRYVEFTHFSPSQPNHLLTVYSKPTQIEESNPVYNKGMICVWNTNDPSYPQRILACESQPVCCCFSPYKATLVFAGMVDGSVCAWDLREPPSLHQTLQYQDTQHIVRFPTYNTAGVMDAENHHSPITTLNPVVSSTDREPDTSDSTDESLGLSFQLVSCEEQGVINFWVVAEISSPDMAGSEVDLGLSPGGRVKLVRSSVISLQSPVSKGSGTVRSFELQLSPQDPNHFYVGTEGGYILHGVRFGSRAFPRTFSAITDAPADVQTLDFSPFGHPCFLVSTYSPVVTWPSKTWGGSFVRCVRWSRTRPCVFYVLDDASHLYTFDFLEGDVLPAKIDTLSSSNKFHLYLSLIISKFILNFIIKVVSFENGSVEVHTISKEYRELQTLEDEFIPSYLARF